MFSQFLGLTLEISHLLSRPIVLFSRCQPSPPSQNHMALLIAEDPVWTHFIETQADFDLLMPTCVLLFAYVEPEH